MYSAIKTGLQSYDFFVIRKTITFAFYMDDYENILLLFRLSFCLCCFRLIASNNRLYIQDKVRPSVGISKKY